MAPKINAELVVPYKHMPAKPRKEASSMMAQSLPMAAMFMRNKILSWSAVFLAIQSYLNDPINAPPAEDGSTSTPASLRVIFALVSLVTCYMDVIFPSSNPGLKKAVVETAAESITSIIETATTGA
ncbi:uncharacterized protein J8A68_000824 [[Candida] subhashii]|uniref:Uncharacterized protein n=1 Tax=[Candida] subhashii TaxID=561895 RepID=A0A8J5QSI4_9ASCO|nr:uncharacterized protein J8A68_000824 [[Candida] subhashii]KAG7665618.1 hypothetical protein J8A68_000824 [[Candida] subhashii]